MDPRRIGTLDGRLYNRMDTEEAVDQERLRCPTGTEALGQRFVRGSRACLQLLGVRDFDTDQPCATAALGAEDCDQVVRLAGRHSLKNLQRVLAGLGHAGTQVRGRLGICGRKPWLAQP